MTDNTVDALQRHEQKHSLDKRSIRALTELLTVVPEVGSLYLVVSQSEQTYTVDAEQGRCTCPDAEYNLENDEACKHQRRVEYETGRRPLPNWICPDAVPHDFALHVEETPVVGVLPDGGETREGLDGEDGCWCDDKETECWECYTAENNEQQG